MTSTWRCAFATCTVLILEVLLPGVSDAADHPRIDVPSGQTALLSVPGVRRVSVGDGEVLGVEVFEESEQVLLIGLGTGVTDLRTWSEDSGGSHYLVRVHANTSQDIQPKIDYLLDGVTGINVRTINGETLLTGKAASEADYQRIITIAERYPGVRNFVEAPGLQETPTIYIKARFVEVRRSTLEQIGLDWSDTSPGIAFSYASDYVTNDFFRNPFAGFPGNGNLPLDIGKNNGYFGIGLSFNSVLDLLSQNGELSVIAEPTLSCLSGSNAEFQAGGEVPIPVQDADGAVNVIFKDYGILLKVSPILGEGGLIRTKVEVEVSDIDPSVTVLGIPGFSVRNASTEMNAPSGETLVIAGLVNSEESTAVDKVPGIGDVPILGELFKSRRFQQEETELVVMVTPYVASDLPQWNRSRIARAADLERNADTPPQRLPILD